MDNSPFLYIKKRKKLKRLIYLGLLGYKPTEIGGEPTEIGGEPTEIH
jgi:hypothetical protein